MANIYYQPGHARGERVRDLFGAIAGRYDLINDLQSFGLHRRWKRRVVRLAEAGPGARVLDVCCGTGDIAGTMAARGAEVMALDFSLPMLRVAGARAASHARVALWMQGDAQHLPFAENTFDAVAVGYGLRNLDNWREGLAEMWRVAKPGGRLLVLEFGKPRNQLWRSIYFAYLGSCVPIFGKLFCKNAPAYAYILESLRHYPAQEGVAAAMRELGCRDARMINLLGGAMSINAGIK